MVEGADIPRTPTTLTPAGGATFSLALDPWSPSMTGLGVNLWPTEDNRYQSLVCHNSSLSLFRPSRFRFRFLSFDRWVVLAHAHTTFFLPRLRITGPKVHALLTRAQDLCGLQALLAMQFFASTILSMYRKKLSKEQELTSLRFNQLLWPSSGLIFVHDKREAAIFNYSVCN